MRVLGISDHYVSGAAVVEDGRLTAAINEERLVRKKMVMGFPWRSIEAALRTADLDASQIDAVAVASEWGHFLERYVDFDDGMFAIDEGPLKRLFFSLGSHLSGLRGKLPILERLYFDLRRPAFAHRRRKIRGVLRREFDLRCPVRFISHHYAHAAAAYYASGYDNALVITLDGAGDGHSSHVYDVWRGRWRLLHSIPSFDSLGDYYAYVTDICGFKAGKHEGKITGLAAYGEPAYRHVLQNFIRYEDGSIVNSGNTFRHAAIRKLRAALPHGYTRENLASTIQEVAERITARYVTHWRQRTGQRNIALAGGVFANVKINQRIHEIDGVDSVFVYPAMADEGLAAGAALSRWAVEAHDPPPHGVRCTDHVYLGPDLSDRAIRDALDGAGLPYTEHEDQETEIARLIAEGCVVARVAGRMEYGPRALGNRSILYRPDEPAVNDWLNGRLGRTEFMPFAPATLAEDADRYFDDLEGAENSARFMTMTFNCTDLMRTTCPGVVHIDGTARPQLVRERDNPSFYRIIHEFRRLTGFSCIVNTSFNIHEEPIVCTPYDAVRAFQGGHLDVLAIGSFIARNPVSERAPRPAAVTAGG